MVLRILIQMQVIRGRCSDTNHKTCYILEWTIEIGENIEILVKANLFLPKTQIFVFILYIYIYIVSFCFSNCFTIYIAIKKIYIFIIDTCI